MKKSMLTATLAGAFGVALSASAALAQPIITDQVNAPAATPYVERYIALEVYNNATGINADQVPFFVHTAQPSTTGNAINIQVVNGKVNEGSGQLFISSRIQDVQGAGCAVTPANDTFVLVAESAAQGVVQPVTTTVYDLNTFCSRNNLGVANAGPNTITVPTGAWISTEHGTINNAGVANTTVKEALNIAVDAGLNPNGDCSLNPEVTVSYVTNKESASRNVLQIRPQIVALPFDQNNALTATLNSDTAFSTFVWNNPLTGETEGLGSLATNPGPNNHTLATAIGNATSPAPGVNVTTPLFRIINQQAQGIVEPVGGVAAPNPLKANLFTSTPLQPDTAATLSFGVVSSAAEPGVGMAYNAHPLTTADNKKWTITGTPVTLADVTTQNLPFVLTNDTTKSMNPTVWHLSSPDFKFAISSFAPNGTATSCVFFNNNPAVGSWTGGLEAYIPFVKSIPNGTVGGPYETYIKLSNRYSKPAPLFVAALSGTKAAPDFTVTSTDQLDKAAGAVTADLTTIPVKGQVTITGQDLLNNQIVAAEDLANGVAVKILIRVPSQLDILGTTQADPYITGIVVSTTPNTQRTIPLDFKLGKNGGLVSN